MTEVTSPTSRTIQTKKRQYESAESGMSLDDVPEQAAVRVVKVNGGWGARQHLREMGVQVGDVIVVLRRAPFGGPLAARSRGAMIAVGRQFARKIKVEPLK